MSILMRRKVSALCWARAGWAGAGLPQSAGRSGAATTSTTSNTENITTTTTTMSEEHFDQWEHYNFEEKVVRSRNSGEAPVLVVPMCLILLSLSVSAHELKFRVGREMKVNRTG